MTKVTTKVTTTMTTQMTIDEGTDWHTHSTTSDGADSLADMVAAGVTAGLHTIGLSDHVRTSTTWLPDYVRTVRALPTDGIRVRCGVEVKMLDSGGRLDLPVELPDLDYLLVADHQFPGDDGPVHPGVVAAAVAAGDLASQDAIEQIVSATCAALRASPYPAIVAHPFSLLPKCGLDEADVSAELLDALASAVLAADAAVEINEKWRCPSSRSVAHLAARGVRLTAGSDAHRTAEVGRWSYLREAVPNA